MSTLLNTIDLELDHLRHCLEHARTHYEEKIFRLACNGPTREQVISSFNTEMELRIEILNAVDTPEPHLEERYTSQVHRSVLLEEEYKQLQRDLKTYKDRKANALGDIEKTRDALVNVRSHFEEE